MAGVAIASPSQCAQFHGVGKKTIAARIAIPAPICTTKSSAKFGLGLVTATLYGPTQAGRSPSRNLISFCLRSNRGVGLFVISSRPMKKKQSNSVAKVKPRVNSSNGSKRGASLPQQRTYEIPDHRLEKHEFIVRQVRKGKDEECCYEVSGDLSAAAPPIRDSKYLNKQQCIEIYRWMVLNRRMEQALENLYKQGKVVGGVYFGLGQEACSCASAYALHKDDWLAPMIRNQGALLVRGFDPRDLSAVKPVAGSSDLAAGREAVRQVLVADEVLGYIVDIVGATRHSPALQLGVSPRGATALLATARSWAWLSGRNYVTPDDVKAMARPTLRHRVSLRPEAELEGANADGVLDGILSAVPVPR